MYDYQDQYKLPLDSQLGRQLRAFSSTLEEDFIYLFVVRMGEESERERGVVGWRDWGQLKQGRTNTITAQRVHGASVFHNVSLADQLKAGGEEECKGEREREEGGDRSGLLDS